MRHSLKYYLVNGADALVTILIGAAVDFLGWLYKTACKMDAAYQRWQRSR